MLKNMGTLDRSIRIVLGSGFVVSSFLLSQLLTPLRVFAFIVGMIFVITSSTGY